MFANVPYILGQAGGLKNIPELSFAIPKFSPESVVSYVHKKQYGLKKKSRKKIHEKNRSKDWLEHLRMKNMVAKAFVSS